MPAAKKAAATPRKRKPDELIQSDEEIVVEKLEEDEGRKYGNPGPNTSKNVTVSTTIKPSTATTGTNGVHVAQQGSVHHSADQPDYL